ncbi:MAG TPA: hypothetical protein VFS67_22090 [Polyangiaceae bacterium]|nr:hypothetical protein [Polyangiaceae bacterium]
MQDEEPPLNEEWEDWLRLLKSFEKGPDGARVLVLTRGGGPTPHQRSRISQVVGKPNLLVAVVTSSVKVRFIVSSVALVIPRIRSFPWEGLREAYAHLGLSTQEQEQVGRNLAEMRRIIGVQ